MILKKMKYCEYSSLPKAWCFDEFNLGKINLLVGKNASGKTRTLSSIFNIANLVCGDVQLIFKTGDYALELENGTDKYKYMLKYENKAIIKETLVLNDVTLVDRGLDGTGIILFEENKNFLKFQVPNNQLACVVRRDSIQHPFFQSLYDWGKATRLYSFGTELGRTSFAVYNSQNSIDNPNLKEPSAADVVRIYKKGIDQYGNEYNNLIIKSMSELGYNIKDIGVEPNPDIKIINSLAELAGHMMFVVEEDIDTKIYQLKLSQGMFRCLSLFAELYYAKLAGNPDLIIIDDIGEGLDFERSTSLIKMLIDIAKNSSFQLIMSTNDRFVMNNVPLEYWQIIQRRGGHCKIYNYENSKRIFSNFEYTGLSNFDFFATDFNSIGQEDK